ncbi:MAG: hypothetical protein Ta2B_25840 [Termitinemataceae bacterium]|nr:MAG: hypothetical protein Ta2B_25840 [Termitinemataceae bacterium]
MAHTYWLKLGNITRELPLVPVSSGTSIASYVMLGNTGLAQQIALFAGDSVLCRMMALAAVLCFTGILGKIGKYIPASSISGFLFIIGFKLNLVTNLKLIGGASVWYRCTKQKPVHHFSCRLSCKIHRKLVRITRLA